MNYTKTYIRIIKKARTENRVREDGYYERHHIKPSSLYPQFDKSSWNLVLLTAREHFICHWLLTKMFSDTSKKKKMIYAFNGMCRYDKSQTDRKNNSRNFQTARKLFSEFHPCKDNLIRTKISNTLKLKNSMKSEEERWRVEREERSCLCGCGKKFIVTKISKRKYFHSSHAPRSTEESNSKRSKTMKDKLSKMDGNQMVERMKNSCGSCDQIERGKKISSSKKGKKTKQQEIMGKRYVAMDNESFADFLKDKTPAMITRITNLRNRYVKSMG